MAPNPIDQRVEVVVPSVDVLPHELVRVGCGPGVAASAADEQFAVISGGAGDPARRVFGVKGGLGHDGRFSVDGDERVDVPRRRDVDFVLNFFFGLFIYQWDFCKET